MKLDRETDAAFAYGCRWQSDFPLTAYSSLDLGGQADITVTNRGGLPSPFFPLTPEFPSFSRSHMRYESEQMLADVTATNIDIWPGRMWPGHLPPSFFGTVTAACLTWSGGVAVHGSGIAIDGQAVLICGESGAGKSTLTAVLLAHGARLVSDDLSVLVPQPKGATPRLFTGRRTLRLYPDVARILSQSVTYDAPSYAAGNKLVVTPPAADPQSSIPVRLVLVLGEANAASEGPGSLLERNLYRPSRLSRIPGSELRRLSLEAFAQAVPVLVHPPVQARTPQAFHQLADSVLQLLESVWR